MQGKIRAFGFPSIRPQCASGKLLSKKPTCHDLMAVQPPGSKTEETAFPAIAKTSARFWLGVLLSKDYSLTNRPKPFSENSMTSRLKDFQTSQIPNEIFGRSSIGSLWACASVSPSLSDWRKVSVSTMRKAAGRI